MKLIEMLHGYNSLCSNIQKEFPDGLLNGKPTKLQQKFLDENSAVVFFCGAYGAGKTWALQKKLSEYKDTDCRVLYIDSYGCNDDDYFNLDGQEFSEIFIEHAECMSKLQFCFTASMLRGTKEKHLYAIFNGEIPDYLRHENGVKIYVASLKEFQR